MLQLNQAQSNQFHKDPARLPRVSVIIPTYNNAAYIGEALDSVFSQNYDDYEIIVVDDGSTDDTRKVLEPYQAQIRYIYQQNAGSAVARNTGLDMARGEFVVFLDADDLLLPGKLKQQAAYLTLRPSLGLVHSGWRLMDEKGYPLADIEPWHEAPNLDLATWVQYKPVKMGAMMFRRLWLESVGGFAPELRQSQDVDLMLRLALVGCPAEWIYRPTLCYRIHRASTIRKNASRQAEYHLAALDRFFSHPNLPEQINRQKSNVYYYSLLHLAWFYYSNGSIENMTAQLRQTLEFSPYDPVHTLLDWLTQFKTWNVRHGQVDDSLDKIWDEMLTVLSGKDTRWQDVESFVRLWWARQKSQPQWRSTTLNELWPYWQRAVARSAQTPQLAPETYLEWWLYVWQPYANQQRKVGLQSLGLFNELSTDQLVNLFQFSIVCDPSAVTPAQINQLWQDLQDSRPIPAAEQAAVTGAFLTGFGQAALERQWQTARQWLAPALRFGVRFSTLRAWLRFFQQGLWFMGSGLYQNQLNRIEK